MDSHVKQNGGGRTHLHLFSMHNICFVTTQLFSSNPLHQNQLMKTA